MGTVQTHGAETARLDDLAPGVYFLQPPEGSAFDPVRFVITR